MQPAAVIFDMDGLLLDTERLCLDCFIATRRAFGLSDAADVYLQCVGLRGADSRRIIRDSLDDRVDDAAFDQDWRGRILRALTQPVPRKAGALRLVAALAAQGMPMAVATSTRRAPAMQQLERAGLLSYFARVIGGDDVAKHKPDPEVYHKAADALGVAAAHCVAFEDSDTGTRAAVASGARVVQVPDLVPPSAEVRALGHVIAPNLIVGAYEVGLVPEIS